MDIGPVINSITVMALMILVGLVIELKFKTEEQVKSIFIFIVINVAIPSVVINSFFTNQLDKKQFYDLSIILLISIICNVIGLLITYFIYKLFGDSDKMARQKSIISGVGNTGFIGIPLAFSIFGSLGGVYAAFYDAGTIMVVFSLGLVLLQKQVGSFLKVVKNVFNLPIIALVSCLILTLVNLEPPKVLIELTGHLSALSAPLAMFYVGLTIPKTYQVFKKHKYIKETLLPLSLRLLILPLIVMLIVTSLSLSTEVQMIVILQASMPSIILAAIFLKKYGYDEEYGVMAVIYATLLSLVTIPVIALISKFFI